MSTEPKPIPALGSLVIQGFTGTRSAGDTQATANETLRKQQEEQARLDEAGVMSAFRQSREDPDDQIGFLIADAVLRDEDEQGTPAGWWASIRATEIADLTSDEVEILDDNVKGPQSLARLKAQIMMRRERDQVYADAGGLSAFTGRVMGAAMDPAAWAVTAGASVAFRALKLGSGALVAAGRPGAAAASAIAESAVAEAALTGVADAFGTGQGLEEYAIAVSTGALLGTLPAAGAYRSAAEAQVMRLANDAINEAGNRIEVDPVARRDQIKQDLEELQQVVTREPGDNDVVVPRDVREEIEAEYNGDKTPDPEVQVEAKVAEVEQRVEEKVEPTPEPEPADPVIETPEVVELTPEEWATSVVSALREAHTAKDYSRTFPMIRDFMETSTLEQRDAVPEEIKQEMLKLLDEAEAEAAPVVPRPDTEKVIGGDPSAPVTVSWKVQSKQDLVRYNQDKSGVGTHTARQVLQAVLDNPNPNAHAHQPLARFLLNKLDGEGSPLDRVQVVVTKRNVRGQSSAGGVLRVPRAGPGDAPMGKNNDLGATISNMGQWAYDTLLHELVHAFTQVQVGVWNTAPASLPKEIREVLDGMERLRLEVRAAAEAQGIDLTKNNGISYAVRNLDEFMAMTTTDADTMRFLASRPATPDFGGKFSSAYRQVVQAFKRLLGLSDPELKGTALEQAHWAFEQMILRRASGAVDRTGMPIPGWPGDGPRVKTPEIPAPSSASGPRLPSELPYDRTPRKLLVGKKAFAEQLYKHVEFVRVTWDDGQTMFEAIRGVNREHALARGRANWIDARVEWVAREQAESVDPDLVRTVDEIMAKTAPPAPAGGVNPVLTIPAARRHAQRLEQHALTLLAQRPINVNRLKVLTSKFGSMSDGLVLAASQNPIAQMVASLVSETTTGAAGRKATVSISKYMLERKMIGTALQDYQVATDGWRKANGYGIKDLIDQKGQAQFNREVHIEILRRRDTGAPVSQDPHIRMAADALEAGFTRALDEQKKASVLGAGRLPETSVGYIPQALNGRLLATLPTEEIRLLENHLAEHFAASMGWNLKFAQQFAPYYVNRARARAQNTKSIDVGAAGSNAADVVRDTLAAMRAANVDPDAIDVALKALAEQSKAGQGQTKHRLDVGLLTELPNGKLVLDYFEGDPLTLYRRYMTRTSGTVALTRFGIHGATGVRHLRDAMTSSEATVRAEQAEIDAFDRIMGEILGAPIEGEVISHTANQLATLVRLQRLGGMIFTQMGELSNFVTTLGISAALKGMGTLPRMIGEVGRVKRGQDPMNHVLTSMETFGGPFGGDNYRMVMPLEPTDLRLAEYANDQGLASRMLSGGQYLQAKITGFRALMAVQHRMVAEQITLKALRYIRETTITPEGGMVFKDASKQAALRDMGFDDELVAHFVQHMDRIATFDKDGRVTSFDVTQVPNPRAAEQFVQSVHRGVNQIIQGTFIGERTKWMHNDYLRLLFQLRTFGVTATEKQWARQRENAGGGLGGYGVVAMMLVAQSSLVLPIHLARVHAASVGREDQEQFIKDNTSMVALARATMNYSALSGLGGDAWEVLTGLGAAWGVAPRETLGVRSNQSLSPTSVVPILGTADQAVRAVGNIPKAAGGDGNAAYQMLKQLPGSNMPFVIPFINLFKED